MPTKESVANTENASQPTQKNEREDAAGLSTAEPTRRQEDTSQAPPTSICVSAHPTFFCNANRRGFSFGPSRHLVYFTIR